MASPDPNSGSGNGGNDGNASGGGLPKPIQQKMETALGADFSDVKIHQNSSQASDAGALAYTQGKDVHFAPGQFQADTTKGQELIGHELTHVVQQSKGSVQATGETQSGMPLNDDKGLENEADQMGRKAAQMKPDGNAAVSKLPSALGPVQRKVIQRADEETPIQQLDRLLDKWNVPEDDVIALIRGMSAADKLTVATTPKYKGLLADCMNFSEMMRIVTVLPLTLAQKLEWLNAAAFLTRSIGYGEIQALVTAAPQAERDALKTNGWKDFFVQVCTNATIITALNDLRFDLVTKLNWLQAEVFSVRMEIGYATIQPWIMAAGQAERNTLNTDAWRDFFVGVCTNATMITALNDLGFSLATKLAWLEAETVSVRMEIAYATIQPWITAAGQAERDGLKTDRWRDFFVKVCTNATMETALTDLGYDLRTKLRWMVAEGCGYEAFKRVILASPGEIAAALADQAFLLELKAHFWWNDFAKCVQLLGRTAPTGAQLMASPAVIAAYAVAWPASNPAIVAAPPAVAPANLHEEGGFIYLNLVTGALTTDRVAAGAQASLPLNGPNPPENAITVGGYHTHPNVGPAWGPPFPSPADTNWATRNGIPLLYQGAFPAVANTSMGFTGPNQRLNLAGDRGFPGTAGGIAPQTPLNGSFDEI